MFVGYTNGLLECRDPSSLEVTSSVNLHMKVMAMVSDEKTIYISLRSGQIIYLPISDLDESKKEILQHRNMK